MSNNVIVFGWNRSLPGRESLSGQHFQEFMQYLQAQKTQGVIESFEPILLDPHGGQINGFFLIQGEESKLSSLTGTQEWAQHQVRAMLHLDGMAVWRGVVGAAVTERMEMWMRAIPR